MMLRTALSLLLMLSFWSCQSSQEKADFPDSPQPSVVAERRVEQPVAELRLIMRQLHANMKSIKTQLKAGETIAPDQLKDFERMLTATPSHPSKTEGSYAGMAEVFLAKYKEIAVSGDRQLEVYNEAVTLCVACHEQKCPGPVRTIKKLKLTPQG